MPLYLVMGTSEFDYERRDLPRSVHYVGACLWDKPRHEKPADWLAELPHDRPWVHASEGTVHVLSPFVLKAAAQGLANLPMQVILTTGGNREPEELDLGPIAPNVRVVRWVSHTELLPHLDVMITTGGSATVQSTLKAGVPLIVVPTEWDKPDIARRVVESGAGIAPGAGAMYARSGSGRRWNRCCIRRHFARTRNAWPPPSPAMAVRPLPPICWKPWRGSGNRHKSGALLVPIFQRCGGLFPQGMLMWNRLATPN